MDRFHLRWRATSPGARRAREITRTASLFLEKRQVGPRAAHDGREYSRILGIAGLPHLRRSLARAALRGRRVTAPSPTRIAWRLATVVDVVSETPRTRTVKLDVPDWPGHRAGQDVDVRLTAEDGYQTERSYSIASPPEDRQLSLTVERLEEGEVSPYLTEEIRAGDQLEIRGPIGGYFVWEVGTGGPSLLTPGGP